MSVITLKESIQNISKLEKVVTKSLFHTLHLKETNKTEKIPESLHESWTLLGNLRKEYHQLMKLSTKGHFTIADQNQIDKKCFAILSYIRAGEKTILKEAHFLNDTNSFIRTPTSPFLSNRDS
jgi:uracil phosphoribosyltransferase